MCNRAENQKQNYKQITTRTEVRSEPSRAVPPSCCLTLPFYRTNTTFFEQCLKKLTLLNPY